MQDTVIDRVVPRHMRRANDIVRSLMHYYGRAGRAACREAAAALFGQNSWDDLQLACMHQYPSAPFDEVCPDLGRRRRAQARLLCSRLGGVDPAGRFESPARSNSPPDPVESILRGEARMEQAGRRYAQLLAQVLVAELQPTAYEPVRGNGAELLASASRGTVAALPLYLARWWNVNLKHQREVAQDLGNFAVDADSRADLLRFGQYWGALCMYHAYGISWNMVIGTACHLAERYADLSLPLMPEMSALRARKSNREWADADFEQLCELHWRQVIEHLSVFPRDDVVEVVQAQPKAFLADGKQVLKILSDPRSKRGTWR